MSAGPIQTNSTEDVVEVLGQAIGTFAQGRGQSTVVTARDGRLSGPDLQDALNQGLIRSGVDVIDVGMVPTPVLYFAALNTRDRFRSDGHREPQSS